LKISVQNKGRIEISIIWGGNIVSASDMMLQYSWFCIWYNSNLSL